VGATIRYTTDDSPPTEVSEPYVDPFTITGATRIRAKAFLSGWNPSRETVVKFFAEGDFTPASIPNLSLWVRGDAGLEPERVSSWTDQGGASNNLTQVDIAKRPQIVFDQGSRQPVVRLDGLDDTLLFATGLTNIRTVFWVIRANASANTSYHYLLGQAGSYDFCSGATSKIWDTTYTNAAIKSGETRLNGAVVPGTTTNRPTNLSIISLVTTGNVKADAFSRDRTYASRSWSGDLAELVIYDRDLTPSEVRSVSEFLANRYGLTLAP